MFFSFFSNRSQEIYSDILSGKNVSPLSVAPWKGSRHGTAWIATSTDPDFNRMQSLNTIVSKPEYKQEIMTNGGTQYIIQGSSCGITRDLLVLTTNRISQSATPSW